MENKPKLKKTLILILLFSLFLIVLTITYNNYKYYQYTKNYNDRLNKIISLVLDKYPTINETEIIEIINSSETSYENVLSSYGIDIKKDSIILENDILHNKFLVLDIILVLTSILLIVLIFLTYNKRKDKDIKNITKLIEEINHKNYSLDIDNISEDELSILKNEIYKTTIMLKELADNSIKDKENLKNSLQDISHQLKTPLTSILINLDNLIEDKKMSQKDRDKFLYSIKREITHISNLIKDILTLSKFDANTITFIKKEHPVDELITKSIKNVEIEADIKNIKIIYKKSKQLTLTCDFKWEIEALSNIIKNCLEHSHSNSIVEVTSSKNNIYTEITIKDTGTGISKKDLPHIFERFYKGQDSKDESVGIGLALSKSIIEEDNGKIFVESKLNEGTTFTIKYYNY